MEVVILIAVCLIVVFIWFSNDENLTQSELHSKIRYETTVQLEKETSEKLKRGS